MQKTRISVAMTFYNGKRFFKEQIQSLLKQTLPFDELIVSDDFSNQDEYLELVEYVSSLNDKRIRIIRNERNLGYANNFMHCCDSASGEIVFLCDQDDIWSNTKIEKIASIMFNNQNINLLCTDIDPFYTTKDSPKWDKDNLKTMKNDCSIEYLNISLDNYHLKRSGSSMCIRSSFFKKVLRYWDYGWAHDDFIWKMSLFDGSCAIYHENLTFRRIHDSNTSEIKRRFLQKRIEDVESSLQKIRVLREYNELIKPKNGTDVLNKMQTAEQKRLNFLKSKNIFRWFPLFFKYRYSYPRKKGLYLDLYLFLFKEYRS